MALRISCLLALIICTAVSRADDIGGIKINGSLDLNYVYNFNNPPPVTPPTSGNLTQPAGNNRLRVFDIYHDDFNLALAELTLQKTKGDTSVFIAFVAGHTAEILSQNDEVTKNISQAYVNYSPHTLPQLSMNAGKMYTHLGLEYIKTKENWNYSRSLLFGYALPYWHTGAAIHYSFLDDKLTPSFYLYNETNGVYETTRSKTVGAQLKIVPLTDAKIFYNFLSGNEASADGVTHLRTLHELVLTYKIFSNLEFAADTVYGQLTKSKADEKNGEWLAWSAAVKWTRGFFSLSPRYEIYADRSGVSLLPGDATHPPTPQQVSSATLTASFDCGDGLETRIEYRQDHSSAAPYLTNDVAMSPSQTTLTAGILYDF